MAVGSSNDFDLIVLGAGTGGYTAAFRAAQLGLRVALVDEDKLGGTCLHRGCIPTKALLESADFLARVRRAAEFGITVGGDVGFDYPTMARRRDQVVRRMWTGLKTLVPKNKVTWVQGRGRLEGAGRVRVKLAADDGEGETSSGGSAGERLLRATDVILATGSRVKSLPGLELDGRRILSSDDVLRTDTLPESIVIVGAGAVGCEFASMYHDLGVRVTMLEYLPAIVPLEDRDVSRELERSFTRRGIRVMTRARFDPKEVVAGERDVCLTVGPEGDKAEELRAEQMLVATGRAANTEDVGLESVGIVPEKGVVPVDGRMRTKAPHVYAIGDLVGGLWLAHVAAHEGILAAHTIAGENTEPIDYDDQPRATYCRPQVASVGLTEQECEKRGLHVRKGVFRFQANAKAVIEGDHEGFVKVIGDTRTNDTLGVHMIGPHVTDLIAEASLAASLDATPWEIGGATHPHPTLAEVLGEAALAVDGRQINA